MSALNYGKLNKRKVVLSIILLAVLAVGILVMPLLMADKTYRENSRCVISMYMEQPIEEDVVKVTAKIDKNFGISDLTLTLKYDEKYFELVSITPQIALSQLSFDYVSPDEEDFDQNDVKLEWTGEENDISKGVFVSFTFLKKKDLSDKTSTIKLVCKTGQSKYVAEDGKKENCIVGVGALQLMTKEDIMIASQTDAVVSLTVLQIVLIAIICSVVICALVLILVFTVLPKRKNVERKNRLDAKYKKATEEKKEVKIDQRK